MHTPTPAPLEMGGKEYRTVKIGNQIWMAENFALLTPGSWYYNDDAAQGEPFGRLYSWDAAMQACPEGWRLPTEEDWEQLISHLGGENQAFHQLLEGGESGFDALFAGYRSLTGAFLSIERAADFWTGTPAGDANAWLRYLIFKKDKVHRIIDDKRCGFSVRYMRDAH